jgi:hypothetical protein
MENWKRWGLIALVVIGIVFLVKWMAGKGSDLIGNVSNLKVGVYNWFVTGLMAITFIIVAKLAMARYPIAGVKEVIDIA